MNINRPIILGILALAVLPLGCGGGGGDDTTSPPPGKSAKNADSSADDTGGGGAGKAGGATTGPRGAAFQASRPGMATAASSMAGMPGATGAAGAAAGPTGPTKHDEPRISTYGGKKGLLNDPFYVSWKNPPPPPYVFNEVQPLRLASAGIVTPPPKDTEVRVVADRRVSGIMSGDGVYAILETGSDVEIVKPGSQTKDGYRVVSINVDSVKLQKREGNYLLTQTVPLTDVPVGGAQTAGFNGGMMGGRPGAGGFPGRGGAVGGGGSVGKGD